MATTAVSAERYPSERHRRAGHTPGPAQPRDQRIRTPVVAKLEMLNRRLGQRPHRIRMIEEAERKGWLRPGGLVEPTSGNTGVGLAIAAAVKGYSCIFVMPDKVAPEKVALLRAYGAQVVTTPTAVERDSPESYYSVADRLTRGAERVPAEPVFQPDEPHVSKRRAPRSGSRAAAGDSLRGRCRHRGTISGVAKYLKEHNPSVQVVGADPEEASTRNPTPCTPTRSKVSARTSGPAPSIRPWSTPG